MRVWRLAEPDARPVAAMTRQEARSQPRAECLRWTRLHTPAHALRSAFASSGSELVVGVDSELTIIEDDRLWWQHDGAPDPSTLWCMPG